MSEKIKRVVSVILTLIIMSALVLPFYFMTAPDYTIHQMYELDSGWTINVHNDTYENCVLSELELTMCNKGDVLTLWNTIPENIHVDNPALKLYTVHCAFRVAVDNELLYSYGENLLSEGKMLGYGRSFVPLPADCEGKTLKIQLVVSEDNAFDGIQAMSIENGTTLVKNELAESRVNLLITMFLVLFGIIGLLVSMFMNYRTKEFAKTTCISIFSFLIGVWTLCNSDIISLFSTDLKVKVILEYSSFYLVVLPFLGYFYDVARNKKTPKFIKIYYQVCVAVNLLFVAMVFTLHLTNVAHFSTFVTAQHGIILFTLVFILMVAIYQIKEQRRINALTIGFSLAFAVVIFEIFRFNLEKYVIGFHGNKYDSTLEFSALILVCTLLFDFSELVTRHLYESVRANLLEKLAYMDELTGLANRRKCDEAMDELKSDYVIVSLDLNRLKYVNDTFGHKEGDVAIKTFAEILGRSFPNAATCGRFGGDEFIVIMEDVGEAEMEQYLKIANEKVDEYNMQSKKEYELSFAYGVALGAKDSNPREVYTEADRKMYDMKRRMKAEREG